MNKKILTALCTFLASFSAWAVNIDNGFTTNQQGYWMVDMVNGGESSLARITATGTPSGTVHENIDIVFAYRSYVATGSGGVQLSNTTVTTPAYLSAPGEVTSAGSFTGSNQNTIDWTMVSSIEPGSSVLLSTLTLTAQEGTLGLVDFYQYLDEDVIGPGDDFFFSTGTAGAGDLQLFTIDNAEAVGVSHSGGLSGAQGLVESVFNGWAACTFPNMTGPIASGTQAVSPDGVFCGFLSPAVHPIAGAGYGPQDIVSTMSWGVNPDATSATIVTTLGGVPDITEVVDYNPVPVPALNLQMLVLLTILMATIATWFVWQQRKAGS